RRAQMDDRKPYCHPWRRAATDSEGALRHHGEASQVTPVGFTTTVTTATARDGRVLLFYTDNDNALTHVIVSRWKARDLEQTTPEWFAERFSLEELKRLLSVCAEKEEINKIIRALALSSLKPPRDKWWRRLRRRLKAWINRLVPIR